MNIQRYGGGLKCYAKMTLPVTDGHCEVLLDRSGTIVYNRGCTFSALMSFPLGGSAKMSSSTQPGAIAPDQLCINTIRTLSMDAVQKANSGHPGTAMAMAPVDLYAVAGVSALRPNDPIWPNRDRFVLSIGHASMLLYSALH